MARGDSAKYVAVDLGSDKTRIYISGYGIVFDEATVIVKDAKTDKILHIGDYAKNLLGKTSSEHKVIKPIAGGVVSDFNILNTFIKMALKKHEGSLKNSVITVSCATGLSSLEKSYLIKAIEKLGPSHINVEEDTKLSILGTGGDITGNNVLLGIDIGAGKVSAVSVVGNSIINQNTSKKAGKSFDEEVSKLVKQNYNILVGDITAEHIKKSVVSLLKENKTVQVFGYDVNTGMPNNVVIDGNIFNKLVVSYFERYSNLIASLLEKSPKEAVKDICKNGIIVTGGFAKIKGVKQYFENYFGIPVHLSRERSEYATIEGAIKYEEIYKKNI